MIDYYSFLIWETWWYSVVNQVKQSTKEKKNDDRNEKDEHNAEETVDDRSWGQRKKKEDYSPKNGLPAKHFLALKIFSLMIFFHIILKSKQNLKLGNTFSEDIGTIVCLY